MKILKFILDGEKTAPYVCAGWGESWSPVKFLNVGIRNEAGDEVKLLREHEVYWSAVVIFKLMYKNGALR